MLSARHIPLLVLSLLPLAGCTIVTEPAHARGFVGYDAAPPPAPPRPYVELQPPSPGIEFTWVVGYHRWNGHDYQWTPGHYERRPNPTARWEPPHWEVRGGVNVWVDGGWRV